MTDDDFPRETPAPVIASIAAGVGPLPFLAVYSVIFIGHGVFYPVEPPDITSSRTGEAVAGFLAVLIALMLVMTIWWFLNGRRRWTFVLGQLVVLGTTIEFVADANTGSPAVPLVLILTSTAALVCAFLPASWHHVGSQAPSIPKPTIARWSRSKAGSAGYVGARRAREGSEPRADAHASSVHTQYTDRSQEPLSGTPQAGHSRR